MQNNMQNEIGLAIDAWIEAIPDDPYALCPCGCGKKWKFCIPEAEQHEQKFIKDLVARKEQSAWPPYLSVSFRISGFYFRSKLSPVSQ